MRTEQQAKQIFKGAFLLSFAGLFSKILSAGYRVPLQNVTGDLGFYIYQQIYPIIGIALMLSLYGFPAAVSKLKAEKQAEGKELTVQAFYGPLLLALYAGNGVVFLLLFTQAGLLADWMGDPALMPALKTASVVFLLIPLTSLLRGTFQGSGHMAPTAISQIMEQVIRVLIILSVAVYVAYGSDHYYLIGEAAAIGAIAGMLVSSVYLGRKARNLLTWEKGTPFFPFRKNIQSVFVFGLFLCSTQLMLLFIQLADTFTLVPGLIEFGMQTEEARQWKGVLDRGQPLIQFGTVLGSSLALVLLPSITASRVKEKKETLYRHMQSAWKVSFVLSSGAAMGLIVIFPYANRLLFQNTAGTASLRILMVAILVTSLAITTASFLQGFGFVYQPGFYVLSGLVIKFLLNALLVPQMGLPGAAWATVGSLSAVLVLNLLTLKKAVGGFSLQLIPGKAWLSAITAMGLWLVFFQVVFLQIWDLSGRLDDLLYILTASGTGACLYLTIFVKMDGFTAEEMNALPGGQLWKRLSRRRKQKHGNY